MLSYIAPFLLVNSHFVAHRITFTLSRMGYTCLTLNERLTHLRMRAHGYEVRAVVKATGNSAYSVYRTYQLYATNRPLLPPISYNW